MSAMVTAVSRDGRHRFGKAPVESIRLRTGLGVDGDAHLGETVQHLSRVARDPAQPNLRQVHLIHAELHDELAARGFTVGAGQLGENVTTRGVDLLGLSAGTRLRLVVCLRYDLAAPVAPRRRLAALSSSSIQHRYGLLLRLASQPLDHHIHRRISQTDHWALTRCSR